MGISSMNGITDDNETVTTADFQTILGYAQTHHLARLTFWSANRDRPCPGSYPNDDTCSGVAQATGSSPASSPSTPADGHTPHSPPPITTGEIRAQIRAEIRARRRGRSRSPPDTEGS